jgi:hypothetical protein
MNISARILMMGVALTVVSAPAMAREVKEIVGYKETVVVPSKDGNFVKMDVNGDNVVNFKEFQRAASLENEYAIFTRIDVNQDKLVSVDEYRAFDRTKGPRVSKSDGYKSEPADPKTTAELSAETTFVPNTTTRTNFRSGIRY